MFGCASLISLTSGKCEINCDVGVDFNWLSIQQVRLVAPLLHRIDGGLRQQRQSALDSHIAHTAILADYGQQHYGSFNPFPASLRRVLWRYVVDEVRLGYLSGDTNSLIRRWLGNFGECG